MKAAVALASLIETALNQYLGLDPEIRQRLASLEGRVIQLDLLGLGASFYLLPGNDGIQVLSHYSGEPDTRVSTGPATLARLTLGEDSQGLFSGDVEVSGDASLGQEFRNILIAVEFDWEEQLAHITGDLIAHQVGNGLRRGLAWGRQARATLQQNLADYLHYENRSAPTRREIEEFLLSVDVVRSDCDRLEARIQRLCSRWETGNDNK